VNRLAWLALAAMALAPCVGAAFGMWQKAACIERADAAGIPTNLAEGNCK